MCIVGLHTDRASCCQAGIIPFPFQTTSQKRGKSQLDGAYKELLSVYRCRTACCTRVLARANTEH
jgi:hypothetical protein